MQLDSHNQHIPQRPVFSHPPLFVGADAIEDINGVLSHLWADSADVLEPLLDDAEGEYRCVVEPVYRARCGAVCVAADGEGEEVGVRFFEVGDEVEGDPCGACERVAVR